MKKTIHFVIVLFSCQAIILAKDLTVTDGKFTATIKRDNWGVPHIYGAVSYTHLTLPTNREV